jgi:hypothetical protein
MRGGHCERFEDDQEIKNRRMMEIRKGEGEGRGQKKSSRPRRLE